MEISFAMAIFALYYFQAWSFNNESERRRVQRICSRTSRGPGQSLLQNGLCPSMIGESTLSESWFNRKSLSNKVIPFCAAGFVAHTRETPLPSRRHSNQDHGPVCQVQPCQFIARGKPYVESHWQLLVGDKLLRKAASLILLALGFQVRANSTTEAPWMSWRSGDQHIKGFMRLLI